MANPQAPFTVSVVIPLYNKEQAIECTLKSVLRQTRPPEELIIVDDGSTDTSVAVARRVLSAEQTQIRIQFIEQKNAGVSSARNRGAEAASSDYIAFLDADDEWLPTCLAEFEKLAVAFPQAAVLTVRLSTIRPDGVLMLQPSSLPKRFFGELERPLREYSRGYGIISSSSVAISRGAWRRSGGFPPGAQSGEDICCWLKLCMTERFAHSARPLSVRHDEHSDGAARRGSVPHHFSYFLGDLEGRKYLASPNLVKFLASNLAVQIGGFRIARDFAVVSELRRLSASLPLRFRIPSLAALLAPTWALRAAKRWKGASRSRQRRLSVRSESMPNLASR